jgi:predicted transcriptional regulator of viral defense system
VPITTPAKTVVDCFKHRNKIGLDVAIEALRDLMKARPRPDLNEVYRLAQIARVQAVMRPYLEAMV